MLQSLGARQPLLNVDTHEGTDEGLRLVADVVPVRRVELELAWKKRADVSYSKSYTMAKLWLTGRALG